MIMRRGQPLLMPVNPVFVWASLLVALLLNMVPLGRAAWAPDLLMLLLVFWSVHQSTRVGMGA
ncbi:MAG: rod shape-determining protein MreD, partial [Xylophilus sp.]|nr:rod shape-determining protein MreD [Xylophilus sp.]